MPQNPCNLARVIALALLIIALPAQNFAANAVRPVIVNTTITNALTRYLTNVIEISVPNNVFVDEFRTNRVRRDVINLIDLYQTNLILQYRTNVLTVDRYATNLVTAWRTNLKTLNLTNWQNFVLTRTNVLTMDRYATNLVTAWRTNLKTLNLTNSENLVLIRTNWVNQPVTNFVDITRTNFIVLTVTNWAPVTVIATNFASRPATSPAEIPRPPPATVPAPKAEPLPTARVADLARGLEVALAHVGKPTHPGQFPIRLTLLSAAGATLPVSEWRVEEIGKGGLLIGSKTEFSSTMPAGIYRIIARVRTDDGKVKNVLATIEVKADARALHTPADIALAR